MTTHKEFPLSPDDLRSIADTIDGLTKLMFDKNGGWRLPEGVATVPLPILHPDAHDDTEVIGHAIIDDGWVGFRFG